MTVPVVFAIAGVIALLLGLWGGGIKAKELEIPSAPPKVRLFMTVVGLILIGVSIWLSAPSLDDSPQASSVETPTSSVPITRQMPLQLLLLLHQMR